MSAARDAALRLGRALPDPSRPVRSADVDTCARFVLAVDPANERLVEDVARALARSRGYTDPEWDEHVAEGHFTLDALGDARVALAVIAQSAGGEDRV